MNISIDKNTGIVFIDYPDIVFRQNTIKENIDKPKNCCKELKEISSKYKIKSIGGNA